MNIHKYEEAELTVNELELINGGEYGDLLKPISLTYRAICECGYQKPIPSAGYGKVICPQCKQLITNYREEQGHQ